MTYISDVMCKYCSVEDLDILHAKQDREKQIAFPILNCIWPQRGCERCLQTTTCEEGIKLLHDYKLAESFLLHYQMRKRLAFPKKRTCTNCRHNPDKQHTFNHAGGDCRDCHNRSSHHFLKRFNPFLCVYCVHNNDPCHYECVQCDFGSGYSFYAIDQIKGAQANDEVQ